MKVNVCGDVMGDTGYCAHTRGLIEGLDNIGLDVSVETNLPAVWDRSPNLTDQLITILKKPAQRRAITVCISQPIFWPQKLADRPEAFYGFLVFEGDRLPKGWETYCNDERITGIFVPSEHVKSAALASGVTKPIHIIPHGVSADLFTPGYPNRPDFRKIKDDSQCTFLFNKGWANGVNDRSGYDILVKAFVQEFSENESARLLTHINKAYCPPGWDFGVELGKIGVQKNNKILYLDAQVPYNYLPDLYNCANFIMSASKAEGFNLTVLEGMSCGLVPIIPLTGGEQDYANDINGYTYGSEKSIPATGGFLYEGVEWRLPSLEGLRKVLRLAYEAWKDKKIEEKSKAARRTASEEYRWDHTAEKILAVIK